MTFKKSSDGVPDCADGSDESNSTCSNCDTGQYSCSNGGCVDTIVLCNGVMDCPNGEDELHPNCISKSSLIPIGQVWFFIYFEYFPKQQHQKPQLPSQRRHV